MRTQDVRDWRNAVSSVFGVDLLLPVTPCPLTVGGTESVKEIRELIIVSKRALAHVDKVSISQPLYYYYYFRNPN